MPDVVESIPDFFFGILYDPAGVGTVDTALKEHVKAGLEEIFHHVFVGWNNLILEVKPVLLLEFHCLHRDPHEVPFILGTLFSYFCPVIEVITVK